MLGGNAEMFWQSGSMDIQHAYNFSQEQMAYGGSETQLGTGSSKGRWTPKAQWLTFALGLFILLTIGLAIALAVIGVQLAKTKNELKMEHPCLSPNCVQVAGSILNKMDTTVDPCQDFYNFACGSWIRSNPVPPTETSWGQFEILRENLARQIKEILEEDDPEETVPNSFLLAQEFYDTCVSPDERTDDNADLLATIERVLGENDYFSPANFTRILSNLKRELDGNYIFSLDVDLDERNTSNYAVYLDQPRFGLPSSFLVDPEENQWRRNYLILITTVWKFVFPMDAARAAIIAADIVQVETSLAAISTTPEQRRNKTSTYREVTLAQLQNITTDEHALDWEFYFQQTFQVVTTFGNLSFNQEFQPFAPPDEMSFQAPTTDRVVLKNGNLTFPVVLRDAQFFQKLGSVLDVKYNGRDILNYLKWRIILDFGSEANGELRRMFLDYAKVTHGLLLSPEPWRICVEETNMFLGMAVSFRYVEKHFPQKYADQAFELVRNVRDAFDLVLSQLDWLDPRTRALARRKSQNMKTFVGFPDWLKNRDSVDRYYPGLLNLIYPDSHFFNYIQLSRWHVNRNLIRAFLAKDLTEWIVEPAVVNAFYSYEHNSINFPAGILQPPFFRMPMEALNYGAIGAIIGHEITHGFDDTGRQTDSDGNIGDWWEPGTLNSYMERSTCFAEEYNNFTMDIGGFPWHVDGNLTMSENIADNGGLHSAFQAYKLYTQRVGEEGPLPGLEDYSPTQLFFVAFAQIWCGSYTPKTLQQQLMTGPHAPNEFRVKGTLQNFPEFNQVWKCNKTEVDLNWNQFSNKTCRIW